MPETLNSQILFWLHEWWGLTCLMMLAVLECSLTVKHQSYHWRINWLTLLVLIFKMKCIRLVLFRGFHIHAICLPLNTLQSRLHLTLTLGIVKVKASLTYCLNIKLTSHHWRQLYLGNKEISKLYIKNNLTHYEISSFF